MSIFIFILGTIIGSFLNVCIYRMPREESIVYPSSHCPRCGTPLKWYELIPVISFVVQKGECKHCGEKISPQYPLVEILTGALYLSIYFKFGTGIDLIFYLFFFSIIVLITFIDMHHQIIPDNLVLILLISTIIYKLLQLKLYHIPFKVFSSIMGLILGGGVLLLISILSKGGMGGGDIKLMGVLGFLLGAKKIWLNMFLSFVIGGIVGALLLAFKIKGKKDPIPFGPFICIAFLITAFWGDKIIDWYIKSFIL